MNSHNLRFGPATSDRQVEIYTRLVPIFTAIRDQVRTAEYTPSAPDRSGEGLRSAAKQAFKPMRLGSARSARQGSMTPGTTDGATRGVRNPLTPTLSPQGEGARRASEGAALAAGEELGRERNSTRPPARGFAGMGRRSQAPAPEETRVVNPYDRTCGGRNTLTTPIGVRTVGLKRITAAILRIGPGTVDQELTEARQKKGELLARDLHHVTDRQYSAATRSDRGGRERGRHRSDAGRALRRCDSRHDRAFRRNGLACDH